VLVRVELSGTCQRREDLAFEVVADPMAERPLVYHEEPRVDPVVGEPGLLHEALDLSTCTPFERAVGRWQRHGGHGHRATVRIVKGQERRHIDRAYAVGVGGQEPFTEDGTASLDARSCAGLHPGVHHLDAPRQVQLADELLDEIGTVPRGEHELIEALIRVDLHDMTEDRNRSHLE